MAQTAATTLQTIASLLGILLALVGILIAARAANDQRLNRSFAIDRTYLEAFEKSMSGITGSSLLIAKTPPDWNPDLITFDAAIHEFVSRVSDGEHGGLGMIFSHQQYRLVLIRKRREEGHPEVSDESTVAQMLLDLEALAKAWIYPERRQAALIPGLHVYMDFLETTGQQFDNRDLQIDRWLAASQPSRGRLSQRVRHYWLEWRVLWNDVRHGRLGERFREFRIARQESHAMRKIHPRPPRAKYPR